MIRAPKNVDVVHTYFQMSLVPTEVPVHGEMFGSLPLLKLDDHDLRNLLPS